ncbi:MAG TPA: DivIVA domain-containing protein [Actinomycetota bacterium]|nr:DivIVA domain-containing protein [Actinomycetota bacterium]
MSTDLDLPVLMNPDHIRRREFVATRRGYDPAQVREFLGRVADQVQEMQALVRDARLEADAATRAATPRVDPYATLAERVAGVIKAADEEAERSRQVGVDEAERIVAEARAEAQRIRTDAERIRADAEAAAAETRATAEAELRDAREQAHRAIASLSTRREILVEELASMQERLVGVARDLESTIASPETAGIEPMDTESEAFLARSRSEAFAPPPEQSVAAPEPPADETGAPPGLEAIEPTADELDGSDERMIILGEASVETDEDEAESDPGEPPYEGVWAGAEINQLDLPDLPPLDLDWGEGVEEPERDAE